MTLAYRYQVRDSKDTGLGMPRVIPAMLGQRHTPRKWGYNPSTGAEKQRRFNYRLDGIWALPPL